MDLRVYYIIIVYIFSFKYNIRVSKIWQALLTNNLTILITYTYLGLIIYNLKITNV